MSSKHYTKDEMFMLCLYEAAEKAEEMDQPFNRYEIGKAAGILPKGTDAICKLLIRSNFIKKASEEEVYITPHGEKLAEGLRSE